MNIKRKSLAYISRIFCVNAFMVFVSILKVVRYVELRSRNRHIRIDCDYSCGFFARNVFFVVSRWYSRRYFGKNFLPETNRFTCKPLVLMALYFCQESLPEMPETQTNCSGDSCSFFAFLQLSQYVANWQLAQMFVSGIHNAFQSSLVGLMATYTGAGFLPVQFLRAFVSGIIVPPSVRSMMIFSISLYLL